MKLKILFVLALFLSIAGFTHPRLSAGKARLASSYAETGSADSLGSVLHDPAAGEEILGGFGLLVFVQSIRRVLS